MINLSEISNLQEVHVKSKYVDEIKQGLKSPYIHHIIPVKVVADDSLPDKFKILDKRFENDRFCTWWEEDHPPEWAINLSIVKTQSYIEIRTTKNYTTKKAT